MAVCDSTGNYILFGTGSRQPTRTWTRAETSGTDTTGPRVREKLKYTVLKNPPSTVQGRNKSCLTDAFTIQVGGRLYAIDPAIYAPLSASLAVDPVATLPELQARIAEIRTQTGTTPPLAVQLASIPLSQYKKRYTYKATESPAKPSGETTAFSFGYRTGELIQAPYSYSEFVVKILFDFIIPYINDFHFEHGQYIHVVKNGGCYTGNTTIQDLYPDASSDRFGTPLLSQKNMIPFRNGQPYIQYSDVFVFLAPSNNRNNGGKFTSRVGIMLGYDLSLMPVPTIPGSTYANFYNEIKANSELIFIPVISFDERISYINYPPVLGLNLRAVDGSSGDIKDFKNFVESLKVGSANNKGSFTPD